MNLPKKFRIKWERINTKDDMNMLMPGLKDGKMCNRKVIKVTREIHMKIYFNLVLTTSVKAELPKRTSVQTPRHSIKPKKSFSEEEAKCN